jgi:tetratricopeptide (TPR) repeat protein
VTSRAAIRSVKLKAALSALLVCGAIAAAHAQEVQVAPPANDTQAKMRAQALLSEGTSAYGRGEYATALEKFTAAYKIFPSPKLWFNIGQANRDLGRPVEAIAAFDKFLSDAGDAPPETLAEARRSAAELKTKLGQIQVTCATDGAEITVDGKQVGHTPLDDMVWTTPGSHQVAVQHAGFAPAIEDVSVDAGKSTLVNFVLHPIDLRAPNPGGGPGGDARAAESQPVYRRAWFWVAAAVVIGAGVTAVVLSTRESGAGSDGPHATLGVQKAFQ